MFPSEIERGEEHYIRVVGTGLVVEVTWKDHHLQAIITDQQGWVADEDGVNI